MGRKLRVTRGKEEEETKGTYSLFEFGRRGGVKDPLFEDRRHFGLACAQKKGAHQKRVKFESEKALQCQRRRRQNTIPGLTRVGRRILL
jgi:hypothetical protein